MNKKELIKEVAGKTGFSQKDVTEVVNAMLDTIVETLAGGEEINLVGFGKFVIQERAAREARNPRDNSVVLVDAKKAPKFKPSKAFKEALN